MEVKCAYNKLNADLRECRNILNDMSLEDICIQNKRMDEFLQDVDEFLNDIGGIDYVFTSYGKREI